MSLGLPSHSAACDLVTGAEVTMAPKQTDGQGSPITQAYSKRSVSFNIKNAVGRRPIRPSSRVAPASGAWVPVGTVADAGFVWSGGDKCWCFLL